jgi:flagellar basal-body rod protein FlgG
MTVVASSLRSLFSLLLLAPPLVAQAADPAVNQLSSPPSQQNSPKPTPAESPKRVDQPIAATARATNAATEPNLQEILRAAQKANTEARQIVIGNLVNANTPAYKRQIPSFATVLDGSLHTEGEGHDPTVIPASYFVGARLAQPLTDMRAGKLRRTGRELDLAVDGEGFFCVIASDDARWQTIYYTRCGSFAVDRHGCPVLHGLKRDWILCPSLTIAEDAFDIKIAADGDVSLLEPPDGRDAKNAQSRFHIGNIQLHTFPTDSEFIPCGDNVFVVKRKGQYQGGGGLIGTPGMSPRGVLRQGYLEDSNVDPQQEFETLQKLQEQANVLEQAAQLLKVTNGPTSDRTKPLLK